jgi:cytoskeleton protein RodZ
MALSRRVHAFSQPQMTKSGFGERLKREREMRGVTLDEICAATRIGNRFLEALEAEDWDRLPGGVFNRGFVRAVARYLGMDEEALVSEYAVATAGRNPAPQWATPQQPAPTPQTHPIRWAGIALAVVLIAAGAWGWRLYATRRAERRAATISAELAAQPAEEEFQGTSNRPAEPAISDLNNFTPSSAAASDPPVKREAREPLQLKVEAGKGTAITISADGAKVFEGNMIAGQSRQFEAQIDFEVQARDAGAILLELNGQTLPPMGPPGRKGMVVLTRDDLKPGGGSH